MPGLESADDVGRVDKPELLERGGREAGRITLVAQHDDSSLGTGDRGDPPLRGGGEAPLEHVAVDDDSAGNFTSMRALITRPDVDQERAVGELGGSLLRFDPSQVAPGTIKEFVMRYRHRSWRSRRV